MVTVAGVTVSGFEFRAVIAIDPLLLSEDWTTVAESWPEFTKSVDKGTAPASTSELATKSFPLMVRLNVFPKNGASVCEIPGLASVTGFSTGWDTFCPASGTPDK